MQHLDLFKQQLKRTRDLDIVSSSFKQLMVLLFLPTRVISDQLFQVHASILSALVGVDWQWQSEVSGIMGPSTAPAGSVFEFDLG